MILGNKAMTDRVNGHGAVEPWLAQMGPQEALAYCERTLAELRRIVLVAQGKAPPRDQRIQLVPFMPGELKGRVH